MNHCSTACHAGQTIRSQLPVQTTSTLPPPTAPVVPSTITQRLTTPVMTSQCIEATNTTTPLGRLRSAMKDTSYTQMNAFFDAFLVFYSDEHLVIKYVYSQYNKQWLYAYAIMHGCAEPSSAQDITWNEGEKKTNFSRFIDFSPP